MNLIYVQSVDDKTSGRREIVHPSNKSSLLHSLLVGDSSSKYEINDESLNQIYFIKWKE